MGALIYGELGTSKQSLVRLDLAAFILSIPIDTCGVFFGENDPRRQQERYGSVKRCLEAAIEDGALIPAANYSSRRIDLSDSKTAKSQVVATNAVAIPTVTEGEVVLLWGAQFGAATGKKIGTARFKTHVMWCLDHYREQVGAKV